MRTTGYGAALLGGWLALGCGAQGAARADEGMGGTSTAGATSTAGSGTLRPPTDAPDGSESVGASPVKCAETPAPDPAIVRACILSVSCLPPPAAYALSDCIGLGLPASAALPACALGAQTCGEIAACFGTGFYADDCVDGESAGLCVGSKAVTCFNVPRRFVDCEKLGAQCLSYDSDGDGAPDDAGCGFSGGCAANGLSCDGTRLISCRDGVAFGEDCAARGMICVPARDGADAECRLATPECSELGTGSCEASGKGHLCREDGRSIAVDCAELGFSCRETPTRADGVECASAACPPADAAQCFEECDGPLAHLCLGGQRFSVDCRAYGLQGCILDTRADSGDRARCGYD